MKFMTIIYLSILGVVVIGGAYIYRNLTKDDYAEIIIANNSNQNIKLASISYANYNITIKDVLRGKESARIMYDTSAESLERKYVLDVTFSDGTTLHETKLREVGTGEKITIVVDSHDVSTALRKASF